MLARAMILALLPTVVQAAEVDLFVTDYNEDPTREQHALVDRPVRYAAAAEVVVKTADGKVVTFHKPEKVLVHRGQAGNRRKARIFASLGEYEPFSFLLRPRVSLQDVFISAGELTGPGGSAIPARNVVVTSVEGFHGAGRRILMRLGRKWNMGAHSTEFFWCTVKVPSDARPGLYRGKVSVTARGQAVASVDVELEVLPIRLADPPFSMGFNYSRPKDPKALAVHLADMREHGMTSVGPLYDFPLPVHDDDTTALATFLQTYRKAGFGGVCYFATPMNLQLSALAGYGSVSSKRWQQKFIEVMRKLHDETQKHDVPVVMSIGDELTNKGIEGVKIAENLARFAWEELPEVATASDMNGYREVLAMAPYLNVAAFNNGWDGIDHHNGGRHLINRKFIEQVRKAGAIPWFVNGGVGRFPFGLFFWKMTKYGVRGKLEWYYNLRNRRGSVVRTDGTKLWPTLDYERCREGIDDLKYVCKLEALIARARTAKRAEAKRRAAEALLKKIADSITDDWTAYRTGGERFPADGLDVMDPEKAAGMGDFDAIRRAVAHHILTLQDALK